MPSTIFSISEQILRRLKGGRPDAATGVDIREIKAAVVQNLNGMLRIGHLQGTVAAGETIPDGAMLATYLNVPVSTYQKNKSACTLPAMPVSLPMGMGLFEIRPTQVEFTDENGYGELVGNTDAFIPTKPGEYNLALGAGLLNEMGSFIGYWQSGIQAIFTKNILVQGITAVDMDLVVMDLKTLSDFEPLPIYPDYEAACIEAVFKQFLNEGPADSDIDNLTEKKTNGV